RRRLRVPICDVRDSMPGLASKAWTSLPSASRQRVPHITSYQDRKWRIENAGYLLKNPRRQIIVARGSGVTQLLDRIPVASVRHFPHPLPTMAAGRSPVLYVIAGPNGAGKTTFAREFLPAADVVEFLNPDLLAAG